MQVAAVVVKYANPILEERATTHGDYQQVAVTAQRTKEQWRITEGWHLLNECQRQSLELIADKVARILNGNPNFQDHWIDIEGYSSLISSQLKD